MQVVMLMQALCFTGGTLRPTLGNDVRGEDGRPLLATETVRRAASLVNEVWAPYVAAWRGSAGEETTKHQIPATHGIVAYPRSETSIGEETQPRRGGNWQQHGPRSGSSRGQWRGNRCRAREG